MSGSPARRQDQARSEAEGEGLGGITEQDARRSVSGSVPACEVRRETKACVWICEDESLWLPEVRGDAEGGSEANAARRGGAWLVGLYVGISLLFDAIMLFQLNKGADKIVVEELVVEA